MVVCALGTCEVNVGRLAGHGVDKLGCRGTDVVTLGVTDPRRASDVGRALGKREVAQCVNEVERLVHSVDEEPAAHCPSRRWLACEELQELGDRIARPRPAARKWTGQRAGQALEERTVEVVRAAVGNAGGEAMLGTRCARREMRPETQTDQRNTRGVDVGARERVVEYRGDDVLPVGAHDESRSIRAAPWPGPSNANTL